MRSRGGHAGSPIAAPAGKRGGNLGGLRQLRIAGPSITDCLGVQFDAVRALSGQPDPHGVIALSRLGPGTRAVISAR
jgi:hypothetical protein